MTDPAAVYETIKDEVETVLIGNEHVIEQLTISLFTGGHVLLEGVPGVAKTTMAQSFARATGLEYSRVQMTPDILPADVTGTNIYRESTGEFEIQRGPVFANVVLADEINRATPKTQSALLEAMQEGQVTIEGNELPLPSPFMLIATQNPIEMDGTFELPEAQRDRFQLKVRVTILDRDDERALLTQFDDRPDASSADISAVVTKDEIEAVRETVADVHVSEPITEYILDTLTALRKSTDIVHGGSPRASIALMNASKARAAIHGRDYVIPDDIKTLAQPVLAHRLVLSTAAELSDLTPTDVVDRIVANVEPPSDKKAVAKR
jgi:MoxR-like ATPase